MPYYVLILWLLSRIAEVDKEVRLDLLAELWHDIWIGLEDWDYRVNVGHEKGVGKLLFIVQSTREDELQGLCLDTIAWLCVDNGW